MEILWYLPNAGIDGRYLGTRFGGRVADIDYLKQIAIALDKLGFVGALIPTGRECEDAWVIGSALTTVTHKMKFLIAVRPSVMTPAASARMANTFDRISGGRLLINVVTGGSDEELAADGVRIPHDTRYEMTDEFLTIWRQLFTNEPVNFEGKYLHIDNGRNVFPGVQKPYPPLYFGGSSSAAHVVAAKHADVHLTWAEPPHLAKPQIEQVRALAEAQGRTIRFGIRLHIIVRETAQKAWDAANELIQYVDDEVIATAQDSFAKTQSVGQQRMRQLHNGNRDALEVSPNLWTGVGLVRGGAGTALVGDPHTLAQRIEEYRSIGIETFILSGYPHLEEAYRTAELLFPHLPTESVPDATLNTAPGLDFEFARTKSPQPQS